VNDFVELVFSLENLFNLLSDWWTRV